MQPTSLKRLRLAAFMAQSAAPAGATEKLTITGIRGWSLQEPVSQRSYVVIRVDAAGGITGFGETRSATREDLARARSILNGKPATQYEVLRQKLAGMPNMQAALNMALLDIVGQATGAPVYQVLGGPTRHKARAMAILQGATDEALAASMKRAQADGFQAFLTPVIRGTSPNSGQAFVLANKKRFDALRAAGGEQVDFAVDCGGSLTPGDAGVLSDTLERFHPLWIDEPCAQLNIAALKKLASERVTPIGFGRTLHAGNAFQDLLREDCIDVLRPDLALNGISQIKRFAVLAEANYIAVAPYHDGGPIATAAALHLAASLPNFYIQQLPSPDAEADRRMRAEIAGPIETITDGFAALPAGPGLGIKVNTAAVQRGKEVA